MNIRHRSWALILALLAAFSLIAAACGDDDADSGTSGTETSEDSNSSTTNGDSEPSGDVSDLVLGGPQDCPTNPFCIPGLKEVYGVDMSDNFVPLDGGGPLTIAALKGGEIDVAVLFSTNPTIAEEGWVVLDDPEGLINADNIIPVMSDELADAYGAHISEVVNSVSSVLTTEGLTELNRQFEIELMDADEVARAWLEENNLLADGDGEAMDGPDVIIGAQDFTESELLSQLYGQALEAAGYTVRYQALGGYRDIVYASFDSGDINFTAEYAASALEFLNQNAGEATGDIVETADLLSSYLAERGLTALDYSPAVNSNSFVVTQETADQYGLKSIADLAG